MELDWIIKAQPHSATFAWSAANSDASHNLCGTVPLSLKVADAQRTLALSFSERLSRIRSSQSKFAPSL
jgi:hypothetical protein